MVIRSGRKLHSTSVIAPSSPASSKVAQATAGSPGKAKIASGAVTCFPSPQTEHWDCAEGRNNTDKSTKQLQKRVILLIYGRRTMNQYFFVVKADV